MALKGGSKYLNTAVPVAGTPVTTVATTGLPIPGSSGANEVLAVNCGPITVTTASSANTDVWRVAILPANHVVVDATLEIGTGNGSTGKVQLVLLNQATVITDGASAGTIDTPITNSIFSAAQVTTAAGSFRRIGTIPAVETTVTTKAASAGVPVSYDRVIGLQTETAIATANAVVTPVIYIAAV